MIRRPPRASTRRPTGSARVASSFFSEDHAPLVAPQEKHALIRAHAEAREQARTRWGIGYYIGVAASCLVVVSGWWFTLDRNVRSNISPARDPLVQIIDEGMGDFRKNTQQSSSMGAVQDSMNQLRQEFERARTQAVAEQGTSTQAVSPSVLTVPTSTDPHSSTRR